MSRATCSAQRRTCARSPGARKVRACSSPASALAAHTVRDLSEFARDLHRLSVASRTFPVGELVLYQSHLSPRGATYDALGRFPFTGS